MNFSYAKLTTLRPQKEKRLQTFITALLVAVALFLPYMILGEGYFTFYGDFNVQQISFYKLCHEAIRTGNVKWSWFTDLGANFVGSYTFYLLGSPFFWLTIPFPTDFLPYLMGPLFILKFACAALTAYLYIRRFTKTSYAAYLGGLLYAFSGFSVYNIFFNHFHEAIIVFPLLLLSLELLITENRRGFFALMVAVSAIVNYFFFFGMVVFTLIYFIVRVASGAIKVKFARFVTLAFEAVLGVLLAAVILLPSYYAIADNTRVTEFLLGWSGITYGKEQIYLNIIECFFFPPDLPARPVFFPGAEVKWSSLGGWLPVFSMTGVFLWFMNRRKNWLKRVLAICIFMALVPILNSAFYAFNTSYYARWFYMPILLMCLATVMLTEDSSVDWRPGFRWSLGVTLGFVFAIGLFPQRNDEGNIVLGLYTNTATTANYNHISLFDGKLKLSFNILYFVRFWVTAGIAIVGLIMLFFLIKLLKKDRTKFYKSSVACVCIITVIYANFFIASGRSHSYNVKKVVIDQLIEGDINLDGDREDYRIDVYNGVDNTAMFLKYPCINAFHSVVPPSVTEFYNYLDIKRTVASRPEISNVALRPLLSVKYLISSNLLGNEFTEECKTKMPDYRYVKTENDYDIYENMNYIPYGFSYDSYMSYDFCDGYSGESKSMLMLKAVLLDDEQIKKYSDILSDIAVGENGDGENALNISNSAMAQDCKKLKETAAYDFDVDNDGFTAKVTRDKKSLVFFSVPYDEGWTATVNGKKAQIEKVNVGFMAVPVDSGDSVIRFEYETRGLALGAMISLSAAALFVIYLISARLFIKRSVADTVYPEGEELLELWRNEDYKEALADSADVPQEVEEIPVAESNIYGGFKIVSGVLDFDSEDENK